MNQAFFVPFFAAVVFETLLVLLARRLPTRHSLIVATAAISVLAVVALGIQGARDADATNQYIFATRQMRAMPAAESAFNWLSDHARPNDTVVNDPTLGDDATWMYADAGVRPLFASRAGDGNIALNLALDNAGPECAGAAGGTCRPARK